MNRQNLRITVALIAIIGLMACAGAWLLESRSREDSPSPLRISEIAQDSGEGDAYWIEIENTSSEAVSLYGYALTSADHPQKSFVFGNHTLEAGGFTVVTADGTQGDFHAPFRISSGEDTLYLLNASGEAIDCAAVPALASGQSAVRDKDGAWQISYIATPNEENRIASVDELRAQEIDVVAGDLEITEVSPKNRTYFPDENGEFYDYAEIHNTSGESVNLAGWYLSDERENPKMWAFPSVELAADEYLCVHLSGLNRTEGDHIHANFKLKASGTQLFLTNEGGEIASAVTVPEMQADQVYSLTESGWKSTLAPTPQRENTADSSESQAVLPDVYISEISATNSSNVDWIEIANASDVSVDLSDWGLSDNSARPRKWQFPSGTVIGAGEYLCVLASESETDSMLSTGFCLSAEGGYSVVLAQPDGEITDRLFIAQQYRDISYGRQGNSADGRYLETMTPQAENISQSYSGRAESPEFSVSGGLFTTGDTITVALSANSGARIYYTTDNTLPTQSSQLYTSPITITSQTVLRARAFQDDFLPSFATAQSYLFDVKNGSGAVYTVSLVSDPDNFFSDEKGILVAGSGSVANYYQEWEYEANAQVFDCEGNSLLSQECSVRLQGNATRNENQKGFKLIARREYGDALFSGQLFSNREYDTCKAFLLRNSGDDINKTRMRDSVLTSLASNTSVLYQETEVCVVYLNGEYWGHYNLREAVNTELICLHEGWEGDEDALDLVAGTANVLQGSDQTYLDLTDYLANHNPNTQEAYERIDSAIDIQNYIEFMTLQIYTGNTDTLNIKRYRNPNADGKWRWILYDLDWGFSVDTNSFQRWLTAGNKGDGLRADNTFFIACMKNDTFRDRFLTYFGNRLANDLSSEQVVARFKERYDLLSTILPDHFERWGVSEKKYNKEVSELVDYAQSRPTRLLQFAKDSQALNLSQSDMEKYFGGAMEAVGLTYNQIPSL